MKIKKTSNRLKLIEKERKFTNKCRSENDDAKSKLDLFKIESKRISTHTTNKPILERLNRINKDITSMESSLNKNNKLISNNDKLFTREIKNIR